ncbi:MAG: nitroreductase [Gammaproteobacteria bacterium]|jgi:nitroreductase
MRVRDALEQRKSVRAFLDRPVARETVMRILDAARHAPSGVNTQPWKVAVVTGAAKQRLQQKLEAAFRAGEKSRASYIYYPAEWISPYKERRKECAVLMYDAIGISFGDRPRQLEQWARNYRAFDAPVMLLFLMDRIMGQGAFIDYGMFMQSLMLAAEEEGVATCPQASLAEYPDIVTSELGYDDSMQVICGMALGYEKKDAAINSYRTQRMEVDAFTRFLDE